MVCGNELDNGVLLVLVHDDGSPTGINSGTTLADLARFVSTCDRLKGFGFYIRAICQTPTIQPENATA